MSGFLDGIASQASVIDTMNTSQEDIMIIGNVANRLSGLPENAEVQEVTHSTSGEKALEDLVKNSLTLEDTKETRPEYDSESSVLFEITNVYIDIADKAANSYTVLENTAEALLCSSEEELKAASVEFLKPFIKNVDESKLTFKTADKNAVLVECFTNSAKQAVSLDSRYEYEVRLVLKLAAYTKVDAKTLLSF